ncbi:MAG: hypothetical protein IH996_10175 [Proteobacteria bacterium]|nr:hypothetical protein [Pseudomonadota bacterium]
MVTARKIIVIAILAFVLSNPSDAYAQEFVIDDYDFTWNVESVGNAKLSVNKENGIVKIIIVVGDVLSLNRISMTPEEARKIGEILGKTEEIYQKQRGSSSDVSDELEVGAYTVTFETTIKEGFRVRIMPDGLFMFGGGVISRREARGLSQLLLKADELAKIVDEAVDF